MRRFGDASTGFASGWMRVRGTRRRRGVDRGFVLSDHADWPDLLRTIEETGAARVLTTHGFTEPLARYLREERGLDAAHPAGAVRGRGGGLKRFAALYEALDRTTSTNEKVDGARGLLLLDARRRTRPGPSGS